MKYRVKIKNPKIKLSTWRYFNANTLGLIKRAVELFDEETKQEWRLESLAQPLFAFPTYKCYLLVPCAVSHKAKVENFVPH